VTPSQAYEAWGSLFDSGQVRRGSIVRGTRDLPKVYADHYDVDGTRRTPLLRGVRTKSEAKERLADIEARVRAGRHGLAADAAGAGDSAGRTANALGIHQAARGARKRGPQDRPQHNQANPERAGHRPGAGTSRGRRSSGPTSVRSL
jgi:hypothetical protein